MPESNKGSRWWRDWIGKKSDSSCKISNKTFARIEILFKEKDLKYLEFVFVYYRDDPIRKDHGWELGSKIVFAIYLHTRTNKNLQGANSAIVATLGFLIIWICYFGVNLLGIGLHNYGSFTLTYS
ncbi:putative cytochrome c assembly protein [Helianthus annuus]|nr:putative cytochrome c assembly protein [Helianthus annuus]